MRSIEVVGRSYDEAVEEALTQLDLGKEDCDIELIDEPTKGIFGFLRSKQIKIRVTEKETYLDKTVRFISEVTEKMGCPLEKTEIEQQDGYIKILLNGENLGIVIGRRGETLNALQYLTNLVANKNEIVRKRIIIDAEGYRKRREDALIKLALRLAEKVKRTKRRVILEPMNPQERKVIHTTLQHDEFVETFSEGEEPLRKIIISLKK